MKEAFRNKVFYEGNMQTLQRLPDNSIDSIVTDCPYGLGAEPDPAAMLSAWLADGYMAVKGGGFMGKQWDAFVPQPAFWKEVHRVLKPGGHVIAFFGTRTYDWGVMAARLAGFEVRTQCCWMYGSGMPKGCNISKAIDKAAGKKREVVGHYNKHRDGSIRKPNKHKGIGEEGKNGLAGLECGGLLPITAPATAEAAKWEGWNTQIKPAHEPIVLLRKKLSEKTIAANVLKWGTGALNVDACRVKGEAVEAGRAVRQPKEHGIYGEIAATIIKEVNKNGRWPASIVHDGSDAIKIIFPETKTGETNCIKHKAAGVKGNSLKGSKDGSLNSYDGKSIYPADKGNASCYFYCAKASRKERAASKHPTVKPIALMQYFVRMITPPDGICYDPFAGSGTTVEACIMEGFSYLASELEAENKPDIDNRIKRANEALGLFKK